MVDRDLTLRKLAMLEDYASQAGEFRGLTVEEYRADWRTQRAVERTLQLAVEVCVDVANHVIADGRLRVPATYAEAFEIVGAAGLFEGDLERAMVRMARFRNLLVHDYARIDPALVVSILQNQLVDFERFRRAVLRWLEQTAS